VASTDSRISAPAQLLNSIMSFGRGITPPTGQFVGKLIPNNEHPCFHALIPAISGGNPPARNVTLSHLVPNQAMDVGFEGIYIPKNR